MAYPTTLDNFTPVVDDVDDVMAIDINELQTAIESLEAKVGIDSSGVTTTLDYRANTAYGWGNHASAGYIGGSTGATTRAILIANGTGGATLQATGITIDTNDNIIFPTAAANDQKGIIYRGSVRWLHAYYPTNAGGNNIFLGTNAGNFTLTAGVGASWEASNLIGIGASALSAITSGYQLIAIGLSSYAAVTIGSAGVAVGHFSFQRNTGQTGTALGQAAGRYVSGYANTLVGSAAGQGVDGSSTYGYITAIGMSAGLALTTATGGVYIGSYAGSNVTSGSANIIIAYSSLQAYAATLVSGSNNIIIGSAISMALSSTSVSNEMNIANSLYAVGLYGTAKFGIGVTNANITARLHLPAGSTAAYSAPLKFISGSLMSTAEVGAIEFLTDKLYFTITTGATREEITLNDSALTSGKYPKITTNGRLTDGVTPLAGTKIYYVSDTSGGAVTRKLTFTDGILTSET